MPDLPSRSDRIEELLQTYRRHRMVYERLAESLTRFSYWKANTAVPRVDASYTFRAKTVRSLERKLLAWTDDDGKASLPAGLEEVGDLAGGRLVFRYGDDLDVFVRCMKTQVSDWFGHQPELKPKLTTEAGRMVRALRGYDSWHVTLTVHQDSAFWRSLSADDQRQLEGEPARPAMRCEMQFRTALQDAFAESAQADVAALLRLADKLLMQMKHEAKDYVTKEEDELTPPPEAGDEPDGLEIGGVRYPYVHVLNVGRELNIEPNTELFSVDQAMAKFQPNFKRHVWKRLTRRNKASITHDSVAARLEDVGDNLIKVQPAQYSDQAVTNHKFALPIRLDKGRTVSELARDGGKLKALANSPMANTIGIACMVLTSDGAWIASRRSSAVAFDPDRVGCSASGALQWSEREAWSGDERTMDNWILEGMVRECEEELGFRPDKAAIHPLALMREGARAGKPQFFFWVDASKLQTHRSKTEIYGAFRMYSDEEHDDLMFLTSDEATRVARGDEDAIKQVLGGAHPSEELRMNLALALRAQEDG